MKIKVLAFILCVAVINQGLNAAADAQSSTAAKSSSSSSSSSSAAAEIAAAPSTASSSSTTSTESSSTAPGSSSSSSAAAGASEIATSSAAAAEPSSSSLSSATTESFSSSAATGEVPSRTASAAAAATPEPAIKVKLFAGPTETPTTKEAACAGSTPRTSNPTKKFSTLTNTVYDAYAKDCYNGTTFDLHNLDIAEIAPSFFSRVDKPVEILLLNDNQLRRLPDKMSEYSPLKENLVCLDLSNNKLEELPKNIGKFYKLTKLDISHNNLTSLPETIGDIRRYLAGTLDSLHELNAAYNTLKELPDNISMLYKLTRLNLASNNLKQLPETIGNMHELTHLNLSGNILTRLPNSITALHKLAYLNIKKTANATIQVPQPENTLHGTNTAYLENPTLTVHDFAVGSGTTKLGLLDQYYNKSTDTLDLAGLGLEKIDMGVFTYINSQLPLGKLKTIDLRYNYLTSIPDDINALKNVETILLAGNQLTTLPDTIGALSDDAIGGTPKLEFLDISNNPLTKLPSSLIKLNNAIIRMDRTPNELQEKRKIFPPRHITSIDLIRQFHNEKTRTLTLSAPDNAASLHRQITKIDDEVFEQIHKEWPSLQKLIIENTELTAIPKAISELSNLTVLTIHNNSKLQTLPSTISKLTSLQSLLIINNQSLGDLPKNIGELSNLQALTVSNNALTSLPESMGKLHRLTLLDLSHNKGLTDSGIPESVKQLHGITVKTTSTGIKTTTWSTPVQEPEEQKRTAAPATAEATSATAQKEKTAPANIPHITKDTYLEHFYDQSTATLTLSGLHVEKIDDNVFTKNIVFTNNSTLPKLNLSKNYLTALPESIINLTKLHELDLSANPLTKLSDSLFHTIGFDSLRELETLILNGTPLTKLPDSLVTVQKIDFIAQPNAPARTLKIVFGATLQQESNLPTTTHGQNTPYLEDPTVSEPKQISDHIKPGILDLAGLGIERIKTSVFYTDLKLETLTLRDNFLTKLPKTIGKLTGLKKLSLANNLLTTLPESIGQLTNLEVLDLRDNPLTKLPDSIVKLKNVTIFMGHSSADDLKTLRKTYRQRHITSIEFVWPWYDSTTKTLDLKAPAANMNQQIRAIDADVFVKMSENAQLKEVTTIDLSDNALTELPDAIARLHKLTTLNLKGNQFKNVPLSNLASAYVSSIKDLDMSENQLTHLPKSFVNLKDLNVLKVNNNKITSIPDGISALSQLTTLDISGNTLTDLPLSMDKLHSLTQLNVSGNKLTAEKIMQSTRNLHLRNITYDRQTLATTASAPKDLESESWIIHEASPAKKRLPTSWNIDTIRSEKRYNDETNTLDLSGLNIKTLDEAFLTAISQDANMQHVTILNLDHNYLEKLPATISELKELTTLSLADNRLTQLPDTLGKLTNLQTLNLSKNALTTLPKTLAQCRLSHLTLDNNKFKKFPLVILDMGKTLKTLALSQNQLTNLPEDIGKKLNQLTSLWAYQNHLTHIPESIGHMKNLKTLILLCTIKS
jgi:Leucine-rich repeat (LRR) protein